VEAIEIPEGTEIKARTGQRCEEGWETNTSVPPTPAPAEAAADDGGWPNFAALAGTRWTPTDPDYREPTLRIDMD
jgi:hypothetical protein